MQPFDSCGAPFFARCAAPMRRAGLHFAVQINGQTFAHILAILENEFDWPMLSGALRLACCMLHVVCCALDVACCTLHAACSMLHTTCMLHVALCMLHAAYCTPYVATCFMLHASCSTLHFGGWRFRLSDPLDYAHSGAGESAHRRKLSLRAVPQHRRLSTPTLRHSRTSKAESTAGTVPLCTFVYASCCCCGPCPHARSGCNILQPGSENRRIRV